MHLKTIALTLLLACCVAMSAAGQEKKPDGDPEQPKKPTAEEIAKLIGDLGSVKYKVRQQASTALLAIGKSVIAPLEKMMADPPNLEAKARAGDIVKELKRRIRWESIKGGTPVAGIQARVRTTKSVYRSGEAVKLEFELRNVTDKPAPVLKLDQLDAQLPDGRINRGSVATGKIFLKCVDGQKFSSRWGRTYGNRGDPKGPKPLAPKKRVARTFTLGELYQSSRRLPPGTYEIHFELYTLKLCKQKANLKSNTIKFTIQGAK